MAEAINYEEKDRKIQHTEHEEFLAGEFFPEFFFNEGFIIVGRKITENFFAKIFFGIRCCVFLLSFFF